MIAMGFRQELGANLERLFTVYDLAAFCYDYLIRNIKRQVQFLGKYTMENEKAKQVNQCHLLKEDFCTIRRNLLFYP